MTDRFFIVSSCKECPFSPDHGGLHICKNLMKSKKEYLIPSDVFNSDQVWSNCDLLVTWRYLP